MYSLAPHLFGRRSPGEDTSRPRGHGKAVSWAVPASGGAMADRKVALAAVAGVAVGAVLGVMALVAGLYVLRRRAMERRGKQLLAEYREPAIDEATRDALNDFVDRRIAEGGSFDDD